MTKATETKIRAQIKFVDKSQREHYMCQRLLFIHECVEEYNSQLLPGEPKITIQEMDEQLSRKV